MNRETILSRMKEEGLRLTPQRVQIVELLFELSHPTAERIYSSMLEKFPYASQATVYNTLKRLKELGLARELANGDKSSHYEIAESEHWHFNCRSCGEIFDVEASPSEPLLAVGGQRGSFHVEGYQVEFYGLCPNCKG